MCKLGHFFQIAFMLHARSCAHNTNFSDQGHGTLHSIYASVDESCRVNGWEGVDVLIIGGDFQVGLSDFRVTLSYSLLGRSKQI